jgi:Domain of unknown function (DUF4350)
MRSICRYSCIIPSLLILLALTSVADAATILFDQGHGQRFVVGDSGPLQLSALADLFRGQGAHVAARTGPLTDVALAATDALVLAGPFAPYSAAEIDAIAGFLDRGGKLAVMVHIGPPLTGLLHRLGVSFSNGVIRERENVVDGDPLNFRVTRFEHSPLTASVRQITLNGVWALMGTAANTEIIARTSPEAWVDLDGNRTLSPADAVQSFGVAVVGRLGQGEFVVFGDDALFQNKFLDGDNSLFARNLALWLQRKG